MNPGLCAKRFCEFGQVGRASADPALNLSETRGRRGRRTPYHTLALRISAAKGYHAFISFCVPSSRARSRGRRVSSTTQNQQSISTRSRERCILIFTETTLACAGGAGSRCTTAGVQPSTATSEHSLGQTCPCSSASWIARTLISLTTAPTMTKQRPTALKAKGRRAKPAGVAMRTVPTPTLPMQARSSILRQTR